MGITVAICCHNSAERLPQTLRHLAAQDAPETLDWEVLVVDNASSDATAATAMQAWEAAAPLRVVPEPRAGLIYARERALGEARHELIGFVDDDNWLAPDWVRGVHALLSARADVGACGGFNHAEAATPNWFSEFQAVYAVGQQAAQAGTVPVLWGAGFAVRREAWRSLRARGYSPTLTGRRFGALSSGEDTELCYALRLAGWKLWYDPSLQLQHYIPSARLAFAYLRRLQYGHGASSAYLDAYEHALVAGTRPPKRRFGRLWVQKMLETLKWSARYAPGLPAYLVRSGAEDPRIPRIDFVAGRLAALWSLRGMYDRQLAAIAAAPWARPGAA